MADSVFYRVQGSGNQWTRAIGDLPITVPLTNGVTYEFDDRQGGQTILAPTLPASPPRVQSAVAINTGSNATSYNSTDSGTGNVAAAAGSNRLILFVVSNATTGTLPPAPTLTFGGVSAEYIIRSARTSGQSKMLFMMREANIPAGAQPIVAGFGTTTVRGCTVEMYTFTGVDQANPIGSNIYEANTTSNDVAAPYTVTASLTLVSAKSVVLYALSQRATGDTYLPYTAPGATLLQSGEQTTTGGQGVAWASAEKRVAAIGPMTISLAGQVKTPAAQLAIEIIGV
jgi:hypothetical protein